MPQTKDVFTLDYSAFEIFLGVKIDLETFINENDTTQSVTPEDLSPQIGGKYAKMTVVELRELAKQRNVKIPTGSRKNEIIALIKFKRGKKI